MKEYCIPVKVFGLTNLHENTHIKFVDDGIIVSVGLNIEEKISQILLFNQLVTGFTGKVYKADTMFVYRHYQKINSQYINSKTIQFVQDELLKRVRIDINAAKGMYYAALSEALKNWKNIPRSGD